MAIPNGIKIPAAFEYVFPAGAMFMGVEPVTDFDAKAEGKADDRARDKDTGELMWQVTVIDNDEEASKFGRSPTVKVKIPAPYAPVPPAAQIPGYRPLVAFVGLTLTPYVDQNKCKQPGVKCGARQAYSIRATGMVDPSVAVSGASAGTAATWSPFPPGSPCAATAPAATATTGAAHEVARTSTTTRPPTSTTTSTTVHSAAPASAARTATTGPNASSAPGAASNATPPAPATGGRPDDHPYLLQPAAPRRHPPGAGARLALPAVPYLGPAPGLHPHHRHLPVLRPHRKEPLMPKPKPLQVALPRSHPFALTFPRLSLLVAFLGAMLNVALAVVRGTWPWRIELTLAAVLCGLWYGWGQLLSTTWAFAAAVALAGVLLAVPVVRGRVWGWLRGARTRRQLLAGFAATRTANTSGRLPRVTRVRRTAVGERLHLALRPGHSAELLDARVEDLRAAVRARDVRVTRDPHRAHRVVVDVVRRDPLAATTAIAWADRDADVLSLWDPVHLGTSETGEPVRLSLVERSLLVGGEPGAGKSSLLNIIAAHAAQSPDAHLLLIDPNEVQFGPWRHRALAYASDDPVEALDVLELVRAEIRRRLTLLRTLPGVVRKVTPDIAAEHRLPLWVLIIDELAFHTSVVGTTGQRNAFGTAARDVVARCRAAGIIPAMATQRPTSDVVPTSLRDLFSLRCAFRTTTTTSSDVILGDAWARRGFSASDIDITARGVGWLLAEGLQPQRIKAAWLDDTTIADLSITTVRHKPARAIPTTEATP